MLATPICAAARPHASMLRTGTRLLSAGRLHKVASWMAKPPCWAARHPWGARGLSTIKGAGGAGDGGEIIEFTANMLKHDSLQAATAAGAGQPRPLGRRKRTAALHIGYVGTAYLGLQANRAMGEDSTIEVVLERAIHAAGLISDANFGDFGKLKWTRSSRTDKGVHSLSTIIGLRVLVDDEAFLTDPEGLGYAAAINAHLPPDLRVFSVQRTTKRFSTRRWCIDRTYEYFLPASVLGLESPDGSAPGDAARLAAFRGALARYEGRHPFHNYAGRRKQYVTSGRKASMLAAAANTAAASDGGSGDGGQRQASERAGVAVAVANSTQGEDEDEEDGGEEGGQQDKPYVQTPRWLAEPDPADPVAVAHYRAITSFTAEDPRPLVPCGEPCLRLRVRGDSFMLHQIRNMVGAAVAVAVGIMSPELHAASLAAPTRVIVPRAPPHTLLLLDSAFSPFAIGYSDEESPIAQHTGPTLTLREGGQRNREQFRRQVLDATIDQQLQHPDWAWWAASVVARTQYAGPETAAVVAAHAAWRVQQAAREEERQRRKQERAELGEQEEGAGGSGGKRGGKQQQRKGGKWHGAGKEGASSGAAARWRGWLQVHRGGLLAAVATAVLGAVRWLLAQLWRARPPLA